MRIVRNQSETGPAQGLDFGLRPPEKQGLNRIKSIKPA
ncbi:hypothetical protein MBEBAB_1950 [Brevundimonas abyssalis TAR-001]|uniref:Uncharacterized protein n=1 Tax=Brevundimonas abyssalis TAR-001 TaxID=1391729 RepID=A0A8E0NC80_9CAUL|nr:hypothetical protein MBEBAB_1950 [Brevundimonas abyssalis TAR-001]